MKGGGKKPWKQKGTGRARAGSSNSPLWVGGGQAQGPKPRDYSYRLPKRTRTQALMSALTAKVLDQKLVVLDDLKIASGKTKDLASVLDKIGVAGTRAMLVLSEKDEMIQRSSANVADLSTIMVEGVNVYDLLKSKYLVGTRKSIEAIQSRINRSLE
jgi:large subunit ribosomal protein L4